MLAEAQGPLPIQPCQACMPPENAAEFPLHHLVVEIAAESLGDSLDYMLYVRVTNNRPGQLKCDARYFQFSPDSGEHLPLNRWPTDFVFTISTRESSVFSLRATHLTAAQEGVLIGGLVFTFEKQQFVVKTPRIRLSASGRSPEWAGDAFFSGRVLLETQRWVADKARR